RAERYLLGACRREHHDALIRLVLEDAEQAVDGGGARVVQIVEPEQERALVGDLPEGVADDHAPRLERVERETNTGGTDGLVGAHRAHPLGCTGDPGATVLVVATDLPAVE